MQPPTGYGHAPGAAASQTPLGSSQGVVISICRHCGVVAPLRGHACDVCKQALDATRGPAPPQPADHAWVAVRCAFTCNSCRFLAPLDALDADGAVECAHCGLRQRFDVDLWTQALGFAHAVGDLAGPAPEGRQPHPVIWIGSENPHVETGTTRTFEHGTFGALAIDVAPGHPVCGRCREPLDLAVPRPGTVQTRCSRCGDQASHVVSDATVGLYPSLVAAVSEEHRSDRPRARAAATSAGVVALSCPSCGAPLNLEQSGTVHTCRYCQASCVVPHQSVARALKQTPEPAVWWLFFQGPSAERRALLTAPEPSEGGQAVRKAARLLKLGGPKTIGDSPGVYEAPERSGFNVLQALLTVGMAALALLLGLGVALLASQFEFAP